MLLVCGWTEAKSIHQGCSMSFPVSVVYMRLKMVPINSRGLTYSTRWSVQSQLAESAGVPV